VAITGFGDSVGSNEQRRTEKKREETLKRKLKTLIKKKK